MPPSRISPYQPRLSCPHCHHKPFVVPGRLKAHIKRAHEYQYALEEEILNNPAVVFPAPPPTADDLDPSKIFDLHHSLHVNPSRVTTTNEVEDDDFDSDVEGTPLDEQPAGSMDLDDEQKTEETTGSFRVEYPGDIHELGTDNSMRETYLDKERIWLPFKSGYEFQLARWMLDAGLAKTHIQNFFNWGLARTPPPNEDGTPGTCFTSPYILDNHLDILDPELGPKSWTTKAVRHEGTGLIEFKFRGLERMIRHIFKQPHHADYMIYKPVREFDSPEQQYRVIGDMHTAEWWWKMQESLPEGSFLIPVFLGSDETFQTNYSGDKNIWPLHVSVGNIPTKYRNTLLHAAWRLLALLPIRPKRAAKTKAEIDAEKTSALETVQMVLELVLGEFTPQHLDHYC